MLGMLARYASSNGLVIGVSKPYTLNMEFAGGLRMVSA